MFLRKFSTWNKSLPAFISVQFEVRFDEYSVFIAVDFSEGIGL